MGDNNVVIIDEDLIGAAKGEVHGLRTKLVTKAGVVNGSVASNNKEVAMLKAQAEEVRSTIFTFFTLKCIIANNS